MQVVDVVVNKPFKDRVKVSSEKHMKENMELYMKGKITASQRRVLLSKWIGEAWESIDRDSIVRGFKKLGISTALDGSEDDQINIPKLPDYQMPSAEEEQEFFLMTDEDSSDDEDEA